MAINDSLGSSLNSTIKSSGGMATQQAPLTSGQMAQLLTAVMQQGGSSAVDAQNLNTLLTQTNDPQVRGQLMQALSTLVSPQPTAQIDKTLSQLVTKFDSQIADIRQNAVGKSGTEQQLKQLSSVLTPLLTAGKMTTKQQQNILQQLQQGNLTSPTLKKLTQLVQQLRSQPATTSNTAILPKLDKLMTEVADKAAPDEKEVFGRLRSLLTRSEPQKSGGTDVEGTRQPQQSETVNGKVEARQQQQDQQQRQTEQETDELDDDIDKLMIDKLSVTSYPSATLENHLAKVKQSVIESVREQQYIDTLFSDNDNLIKASARNVGTALNHAVSDATNDDVQVMKNASTLTPLALIAPYAAVFSSINEADAERSLRRITSEPNITILQLGQLPMESLMLKMSNLSATIFSNTAEMVVKAKEINSDAQKIIIDKKIVEYREQLDKAQEQADKAKKSGITSVIFKWIMPVIAVVAVCFAPMTLPLLIGAGLAVGLGVTSAALSTVKLVKYDLKGEKPPAWLSKTIEGLDWAATAVAVVGTLGAATMWAGAKIATKLGAEAINKLLSNGGKLFQSLLGQSSKYALIIQDTATAVEATSSGVLGIQQANLQKEISDLDLKMEWNQAQLDLLIAAQTMATERLGVLFEQYGDTVQNAARNISDTGSLQARIAGALI